jgi:Flp pilus assembly protein TadB
LFNRILAAHVHWYVGHKRLAWAISVAVSVASFGFWWALFSFEVALVVEAIVLALTVPRWIARRRRLARES